LRFYGPTAFQKRDRAACPLPPGCDVGREGIVTGLTKKTEPFGSHRMGKAAAERRARKETRKHIELCLCVTPPADFRKKNPGEHLGEKKKKHPKKGKGRITCSLLGRSPGGPTEHAGLKLGRGGPQAMQGGV